MIRMAAILSLLSIAAGGCAQRIMTVTSEPSGALVYMNDQELGRTPLTRDFTWYGTYDVQVRKEGYQTLNTKTSVIAPIWEWPPLDLFAALWPGHLVDRRHLNYTLTPATTQQASAEVMLDRAAAMRGELRSSKYTRPPATAPSP